VTLIDSVLPISLVILLKPFNVIVGCVYVGNTVGNNKSLNMSTKVFPVKSDTVVPASIPPTVVSISKLGESVVL